MIPTNPLIIYPDITLTLPPAYCGSVRRYAAMAAFGNAVIDFSRRFNKREKDTHRCSISGPNGIQRLTVPLEKPTEWHSTHLSDVRVSTHGEWWNVHWGAISSAYGRTPFFEYYADDLLPAFSGKIESLMELDDMIDRFCRRALGIPMPGEFPTETATRELPEIIDTPYYQIWADRYGFIPDLSVLDLIFNMGPEAPLVLQRMVKK
ncbi:MAG: WbqC family protein [Lachnospiraceae bacterium]|nr:WbqC family protein [Lachnospiraceae bacterium]